MLEFDVIEGRRGNFRVNVKVDGVNVKVDGVKAGSLRVIKTHGGAAGKAAVEIVETLGLPERDTRRIEHIIHAHFAVKAGVEGGELS